MLLAPYSYISNKWNKAFAIRYHSHYGVTKYASLSTHALDPAKNNGDRSVQVKCIEYKGGAASIEELNENTDATDAECY